MLNEDYRDILQSFLENDVKFLVIGAYAMAAYGIPRATGDLDLWVESSKENSKKIYNALVSFGAPTEKIDEDTFAIPGIVFQIGIAPRRIDIITQIDGVKFTDAYPLRQIIAIDGLDIPFISKEHLIKNKRSTGRLKDLADVEMLIQQHSENQD